jgi:hypothetical protein
MPESLVVVGVVVRFFNDGKTDQDVGASQFLKASSNVVGITDFDVSGFDALKEINHGPATVFSRCGNAPT